MMAFISESPFRADEEIERGRAVSFDPIRAAVCVPLAIYLLPVALLVGLIGGVAILAEGAARIAGRSAPEAIRRQARESRPGAGYHRPRSALADDRARSRAAH